MLRMLQKQRLRKMLEPENIPFKVLVLDQSTQAILSPLFKISDLRDSGVTSHFLMATPRSQIRDAPAIYLLSSAEGLADDIARDLYAAYYINMSSAITRSDLERLAQEASEQQRALRIKAVTDQFIDFSALQEDLFTFNIPQSFVDREDPAVLRRTATGLFSVFVTLGELPFIVGDGGELGRMLQQKIKSVKILKPGVKKPLLIILSRDFDVVTPVQHVMGYAELIHDTLGIKCNRVVVPAAGSSAEAAYDIDTDTEFYKNNLFRDFPAVAETVEHELHTYKKEMALRSLNDKSDRDAIQKALESAPHLQKKNDIINTNISICMRIVEEVKNRRMDDFYQMEQSFDREGLTELCEHGDRNDILRLCLSMLGTRNADLVDAILQKRGIKTSLLEYFRERVRDETGFRERMKSFIFKKSGLLCTHVEEVLGRIKNQSLAGLDCYDTAGAGVFLPEISRVVVYIHGGATYSELKALKEIERAYGIPVVLGGSEILSANEFIGQVEEYLK